MTKEQVIKTMTRWDLLGPLWRALAVVYFFLALAITMKGLLLSNAAMSFYDIGYIAVPLLLCGVFCFGRSHKASLQVIRCAKQLISIDANEAKTKHEA